MVNQYGVHILSPATDKLPFLNQRKKNESKWPDRISKPGPPTLESDALPTALLGPAATSKLNIWQFSICDNFFIYPSKCKVSFFFFSSVSYNLNCMMVIAEENILFQR